MQATQQTTTQETRCHVKVQYNDEIRRFVLEPLSYSQLMGTLREVFSLKDETLLLNVKFLDDEGDWVTFTTDHELFYASSLGMIPLRLNLSLCHYPEQPKEMYQTPEETATTLEEDNNTDFSSHGRGRYGRGRGGRGRCPGTEGHHLGRGGRGGRGRGCRGRSDGESSSPDERKSNKSSRLASRIQDLEAKIESGTIPKDRARVLTWRLQKLQMKQEALKKHQQVGVQTGDVSEEKKQAVEGSSPTNPECLDDFAKKNASYVDEESSAKFTEFYELKKKLKAARQSGNQEEIQSLLQMKQEMKELRKKDKCKNKDRCKRNDQNPHKDNIRQLKAKLHEARDSGNSEEIEKSWKALKQAKREARISSFGNSL